MLRSVGALIIGLASGAIGLASGAFGCRSGEEAPAQEPAPVASEEGAQAAATPAAVARRVLEAFASKDVEKMAAEVPADRREDLRASAGEMFASDKPLMRAMRQWDGERLEVRYSGPEARVAFGVADERLAVLELERGGDGVWAWARVRYADPDDFAGWGSAEPGAPARACSQDGFRPDDRPLPAAWAEAGGAPAGAVACATGETEADRYAFELGSSPEEGAALWRAHLSKAGWQSSDVPDEHGITFTAVRGGVQLRVFTSRHVAGRGWTTVTVTVAE